MSKNRDFADLASTGVGMVHGFSKNANGTLTWDNDVTALQDADGNQMYDEIVVGTADMSFTVDASGHLIMTID